MKFLVFIFLIQSAFAETVMSLPCSKQVMSLASEWNVTSEWSKEYQDGMEDSFFSSPTTTLGEWVVAKEIPTGTAISKVGQSGRIEVSFDKRGCKKLAKSYAHPAPLAGHITDKEIAAFVNKNKKGVIYVWSPRMGLSRSGISEIQKASAKLKLPLLILLDKKVSEKELLDLKKDLGPVVTERVDSLEFKMRNVGQHFPAIMVFNDSKIKSGIKYGYETSHLYQADLVQMLGISK
jgi:hypothetical protein